MGWISSFFSSRGGLHQVLRSGDLLNDLTTGETGFVLSESDGFSLVTDGRGNLHQVIDAGNLHTDLTTNTTWFEV